MKILVINSGSSSVKFQYFSFEGDKEELLLKGMIDRIGLKGTELIMNDKHE
ncbi:MAG: acetate kinase, partial [Candidatus Nanoarchaeia archaeon]